MREIKFKARNADIPTCWIYGYFVIERGHCYIINNEGKFKVRAGTECQYTGREDKIDNQIYENDIMEYWEKELKIRQRYPVEFHLSGYSCSGQSLSELCLSENWTVVGNIITHPDLKLGVVKNEK
jgi:hypothetical protein